MQMDVAISGADVCFFPLSSGFLPSLASRLHCLQDSAMGRGSQQNLQLSAFSSAATTMQCKHLLLLMLLIPDANITGQHRLF